MDLSNPLRSVAPSVEADVLAVLARTHAPLTGLRVHELAGRSYSRVRLVLARLTDHGLVSAQQHGKTYSYVLNRDHVLAGSVEAMVMANRAIEDELRDSAQLAVGAVAVVLFGSFARRDGDADSDIDILMIRSDEMDADDEAWVDQREALVQSLERRSGNRVQIVELSATEFEDAVRHSEPLIDSVRSDGVVLVGALPAIVEEL